MKFVNSLALIIIASVNLALSKRANTKSAFAQTCKKIKLQGTNLSAECEKMDRTWMHTSVNLSTCVTNNNGQLMKGGAYDRSCNSCKLVGTKLSCNCKKMNGRRIATSFDLNTFIANHDGGFGGCGYATTSPIPVEDNKTTLQVCNHGDISPID